LSFRLVDRYGKDVINQLDPIKEVYNIYFKEDKPQITEVAMDLGLDFDSDLGDRPVDPYLEL